MCATLLMKVVDRRLGCHCGCVWRLKDICPWHNELSRLTQKQHQKGDIFGNSGAMYRILQTQQTFSMKTHVVHFCPFKWQRRYGDSDDTQKVEKAHKTDFLGQGEKGVI
eukprot:4934161-Amphidinium_carterae.1